MKYFRKMIDHYIPVNDEEWEQACEIFDVKHVKKGTTIHHAGDVFSEIWLIKSGLARSCLIDMNGKEHTWQLYFRGKSKHGLNHFMDDSVSFYEKTGSMLNFEVLEDSVFYVASLKALDNFISQDQKWETLARIWIHNTYYSATYKRVLSLMSETVAQRYARLLDEYPFIFDQVKSYHIASYLGVAPQTLSKLKNESR
ncbi:Crp/Fnr family transcriptional regulator [Pseudoalteromonas luteoviolacea]|uniref:Crp/Fnr family transcription regulator n=1 Tax=Pseudoalteromonas luteoviolacea S4054 TaxID=1129367 RepID=A0A0F6AHC0_9GAMM|nr:Crp/Fnr family transcriptional regulator [Pseudoalteromonas luteoviolacea]AOT08709.1 Crp/Fnr family transcriptional regulator [Pseudoalteromonas luteoviolacea]AOT13624.1 Crp/Fnr family transcriptional regulator [Pseudoalteromonas luteoviolacea]AOT18537.1 Crp/Fnr family transcriptional regulator [Pseudoalteromonas luteoviolacea]KKE85602.1 Crp/Fnr family transcription regulator [Pseudoalteromonas luteoviolacea S4054]KZN71988.1 Crp/Fnr family transcription regulator [Pseudoalteromonas luteovio